jgi:WD40 repeat protein
LQFKFKLPLPMRDHQPRPHLRTFAISPDGRVLVAGGRGRSLFVFDLTTERLVRVIDLPTHSRAITQVHFLGAPMDSPTQVSIMNERVKH